MVPSSRHFPVMVRRPEGQHDRYRHAGIPAGSGARWFGARWYGARWSGPVWFGARWSGPRWSGPVCAGLYVQVDRRDIVTIWRSPGDW